eukprot:GDKH01023265.1.p1 GENE.GDKH01023265.1~~GDKH01023265.1.p1  ORF type:complete len:70 (+),score=16.07 GDKH01023265.1:150-359(+)
MMQGQLARMAMPRLFQSARFVGSKASPETPLHYYRATKFAASSINHRMFYPNWILVIFLADAGAAMIDV